MYAVLFWYLLYLYYVGAIASTPFVVIMTVIGFEFGHANQEISGVGPVYLNWPFEHFVEDWFTNARIRTGISWAMWCSCVSIALVYTFGEPV